MTKAYDNSILAQNINVSGVNTNVSGVLQVNNIDVSVSGHTHIASDLTSGTLPDARLSSAVATYPAIARVENQAPSVLDIYPRGQGNNPNATPAANQIYVTMFTPSITITVSSIAMACGTTVGSGLTLARMGLYTFDETTLTLVARTASDTTMFAAANTLYQRNFSTVGDYPASYTLNAGSRYGVAVVAVGTTTPSYNARTVGVGIASQTPRMNAVLSGSDLPTSATTFSTAQGHIWARLA